jgi:hypothetical protein
MSFHNYYLSETVLGFRLSHELRAISHEQQLMTFEGQMSHEVQMTPERQMTAEG